MGILNDKYTMNKGTLGDSDYYYKAQTQIFTDLNTLKEFRENYCYNRIDKGFNVIGGKIITKNNNTNNDLNEIKNNIYRSNLGMYVVDGGANPTTTNSANLTYTSTQQYSNTVVDGLYYNQGKLTTSLTLSGKCLSVPHFSEDYKDFKSGNAFGNVIDFDFTKLIVLWQVYVWNIITNTVSLVDYTNFTYDDNNIPIALKPKFYYGEPTKRVVATNWNIKLCCFESELVNEEITNISSYNIGLSNALGDDVTSGYNTIPIIQALNFYSRDTTLKMSYLKNGTFLSNVYNNGFPFELCNNIDIANVDVNNYDFEAYINQTKPTYTILYSFESDRVFPSDVLRILGGSTGLRKIPIKRYILGYNKEYIEKIMSLYGLYYCYSVDDVQKDLTNLTENDNVYLAKITDSGLSVNSEIFKGNTIKNNINYYNKNDIYNDSPYKYDENEGKKDKDNNNYVDTILTDTPNLTTMGCFNTAYATSYNNLKQLASWIWNADDNLFNSIKENLKMYNNPMDALVSIMLFPFDVVKNANSGIGEITDIVFGRTQSEIDGYRLLSNYSCVLDFGTCQFPQKYNNFMDYSNTKAYLYIPYCSVVEIQPSQFIDKIISVKMVVDIQTGSCCAIVYGDNIPYLYQDGQIGVSVPTSSTNVIQTLYGKQNDTVQTNNTITNSIVGSLSNLLNSPNSVLGVMGQLKTTQSNISAIKSQGLMNQINDKGTIQKSGSSTPICSFYQPQYCYFIIDRPIYKLPTNYGHTIGHVANYTEKLENLKGFTVCNNPHVDNIACTSTEKEIIINLLTSGIIL